MMRRIVVMAFGFVLAVGVAAIFLIVSALLDPATREAGFAAATSGLFAFVEEDVRAGGWSEPLATFGFILWSMIIATCVAPLAVAALIGEIAGARSLLWYSGASATLAGASPWIARAAMGLDRAHEASPLELQNRPVVFSDRRGGGGDLLVDRRAAARASDGAPQTVASRSLTRRLPGAEAPIDDARVAIFLRETSSKLPAI